jgi:multidrug efflux pump
LISQVLTLYTTPVIYLYMTRFGHWLRSLKQPTPVLARFGEDDAVKGR